MVPDGVFVVLPGIAVVAIASVVLDATVVVVDVASAVVK